MSSEEGMEVGTLGPSVDSFRGLGEVSPCFVPQMSCPPPAHADFFSGSCFPHSNLLPLQPPLTQHHQFKTPSIARLRIKRPGQASILPVLRPCWTGGGVGLRLLERGWQMRAAGTHMAGGPLSAAGVRANRTPGEQLQHSVRPLCPWMPS
jgi:hypothetical protein